MTSPPDVAVWYGVFLTSTVAHEAAHAFTALRLGDPTAYQGGQVTLDPRPHVRREPVGTVLVPLLSLASGGAMIGWASTPYDPEWAMRHPRQAAMMALAGPLANLLLVAVCGCAIRFGVAAGVLGAPRAVSPSVVAIGPPGTWSALALILSVGFSLNLTLFALNLIPLPPFDGGAALPIMLPTAGGQAYRRMIIASRGVAMVGVLIAFQAIGPRSHRAFLAAVNLFYPPAIQYR